VTGTGLTGGNLEFWPNNYGPANSAKVPNASDQTFDFGDDPSDPVDGYGSMQVHNHEAKQTLFALNHWREGSHADVGIGNQPTGNPDWTFAGNAGSYPVKRLRVLVRPK
jgi:sialate O-acetylesterase